MTSEQRAPVQGFSAGIPWSLHLRAWDAYAKKYGRSQTAERLAERGGFGTCELDVFVPGWRDEVSEITRLQGALAAAEAERNSLLDPATVRVNILHGRIAIPDDLVWLHDTNGPVAALLAEMRKKALEALSAVKTWAEQKCPCRNEEPNPCPLCGASVENLEPCKAVDLTFPRLLRENIAAAIRSLSADEAKP